jgi:predicted nuclease of predicted toxin-antitoxin system
VRFLLDESADARIQPYLRSQGYDASRIASDYQAGLPDQDVLALAVSEDRILITCDNDFGDLVVRQGRAHRGVILFRLGDYAELELWIERLDHVLTHHRSQLDRFIVVTRRQVRVRGRN